MKEFNDTKPIRDILQTFESPDVPDFDSLFMGEVPGDAPLRQSCQSKLSRFETQAPSFDQLFAGQPTMRPAPIRKRLIPAWIAVGAAAACFGLLLLLPGKVQMDPLPLSQVEQTVIKKRHHKKVFKQIPENQTEEVLAQTDKLESPRSIIALAIERKESRTRERLVTYEEVRRERDSSTRKINPSPMDVNYERTVEDAYAEARIKKNKTKRERFNLGTGLNTANRLLSLVNTKTASNYPLQAFAQDYSNGYSSLEGSSSSLLRSATVSRNAWEAPDNIPGDLLDNYEATYSLPINFGISVSFPVSRICEIMTGINYTYMSGNISGKNTDLTFDLKQELHYIGIPVKFSANIYKRDKFGAYAALGGTLEKGLSGVQNSHVKMKNGETSDWHNSQKVYGVQPSITAQFGLYYEVSKTFNLYLEPGASYYIPNDQPISSRTEEPYNFNLGLGIRYRIH